MEFLKEHLSEETYSKLVDELNGKDVKIADLKSGDYVSKEKFEKVKNQADELKNVNNQFSEQISKFDGVDIENLKTQADQIKSDYETKISAMEFNHAFDSALTGAKAKNLRAVKALMETDSIKFEDGKLVGFDEQLEKVKSENDYLFETEQKQKIETGMNHDTPVVKDSFISGLWE